MAAVRYDVTQKAWSTWHLPCKYLTAPDINGDRASALPTGWTVKAQWRKHPNDAAVLQELEPDVNNATGEFDLVLTGEQTAALPSLSHWGVKAYAPGGEPSVPLIEGRFDIEASTVYP